MQGRSGALIFPACWQEFGGETASVSTQLTAQAVKADL
jgi:hypothetical protein